MPLTTIDPTPALIVVDLQKGILTLSGEQSLDGVVERAAALAAGFRSHHLPVALVTVAGDAPGRTEVGRPPSHRSPIGQTRSTTSSPSLATSS